MTQIRIIQTTLLSLLLITLTACANSSSTIRSSSTIEEESGSTVYGSVRYGYQSQKGSLNMSDQGSRIGIKSGNLP